MSAVYDSWERLVDAVLKREKFRQMAHRDSFSTSFSSDISVTVDSPLQDVPASNSTRSSEKVSSSKLQPIKLKQRKKGKNKMNNFGHLFMGEGVLGPVFKGWIHDQTLTTSKHELGLPVAVRIWDAEGSEIEEWSKWFSYLSKLVHPNLVKLVDFCPKEDTIIWVEEFMHSGSLDERLHESGSEGTLSLSWAMRIKVAIGAARGLTFLHESDQNIIYGFFKTTDILLDADCNAKLSDFGWARCRGNYKTHLPNRVKAPEYRHQGVVSHKSDVFGFGLVLLELLTGLQITDITHGFGKKHNPVEWAEPYLCDEGKLVEIMDPRLKWQCSPGEEVFAFCMLTSRCLNTESSARPSMAEVLHELEQLATPKTM